MSGSAAPPNSNSTVAGATETLAGREVVVGVCGGIAAYKIADLVSKLVQLRAGVTVCMTPDAQRFIAPLTFEALSGRPVRTELFDLSDSSDPQHIRLTEQADLMVVAPATSHMIAKIAAGLCDDIVSLLVAASACPVLLAPAMNNRMWENPIARENVAKLQRLSFQIVGPEAGWLACRNTGPGRLADTTDIINAITGLVSQRSTTAVR